MRREETTQQKGLAKGGDAASEVDDRPSPPASSTPADHQTLSTIFGERAPMELSLRQQCSARLLVQAVGQAVAALSPDDQDFLCYRYGLIDGTSHSLEATAARFQLTISETARRESRTLRLLRSPLGDAYSRVSLDSGQDPDVGDTWQGRLSL
jgi:hypothetical protein